MDGVRIKSIEIEGFKSFPEKVVLEVPTGITAIVGPNGSGKSNIFDAIKWCFGDHSPRSLRIKGADDVLFAGNDTRRQAHTCEVSIVFEGEPIRNKYRADEIKITRRYYRTGETEYLMNDEDVRLKDIQDFLLDMGVGAKSVAIVGQGEIVNIAIGKPEELRFYVDEATGIMKYKLRHRDAVKKLELTQNRLARAEDVIKEVKRQMRAIDKHAKKAEKAMKLKAELREAEVFLYSFRYHTYKSNLDSLRESLKGINFRLGELRESLRVKEENLSEIHNKIRSMEQSISVKSREIALKRERKEKIVREIHRLELECKGLEENMTSFKKEAEGLSEILNKLRSRKEELERRKESLMKKLDVERDDMLVLEGDLKQSREKLEKLREGIRKKRELLFELSAEETRKRSEVMEKERETEFLRRSLEKLQKEKGELLNEYYKKANLVAKLEAELREKEIEVDELRSEMRGLNAEIETLREKKAELQKSREKLVVKKEDLSTRFSALEKAIREGEFYAKGTRKVLEKYEGLRERTLSRCIEVKKGFEKAVEGVLREKKESILTDNINEVLDGIKFLKNTKVGKVSFTFVPLLRNHEFVIEKKMGVIAQGDEVIIPRNDFGKAIKNFFKKVVIIRGIEDYPLLKHLFPEGMIIATLEGDVIEGAHFYGGVPEAGIISRESELAEMRADLNELNFKIVSLNSSLDMVDERIKEKERLSIGLKEKVERLENEKRNVEHDIENLKAEQKKLKENSEIVEEEIKQICEMIKREQCLQGSMEERIEELINRIKLLDDDIKVMSEEEKELLTKLEGVSKEWQEKRVETLKIESLLKNVDEEIERINTEKSQFELRRIEVIGACIRNAFRYYKLHYDLHLLKSELLDLEKTLAKIQRSSYKESEVLSSLKKENEEIYSSISSIREEVEKLVEKKGELSSQIAEIETTIQFIRDEVKEKYDIFIENIEKPDIYPAEYEERVRRLREMCSSLGDVAFYTIEEYEELSKRYEFLTSQKEDLVKAMEDITKLINRINTEAKAVFESSFEKIKQRFSQLVSLLMDKAQGNLFLSNPDDMFESGIEITIQPQRKRLKHLHLLSGGEKAIVAIAFIFSLLEAKDMPFMFLDEIDAPLDDVNIKRFSSLIRKVSQEKQIVLITHNKITMEVADALYGVSMEEPGVSKILSVVLA